MTSTQALYRYLLLPALLAFACVLVPSQAHAAVSFENIPKLIGTAELPYEIAPADVDQDGDMDLFFSDNDTDEAGWFENNGTGTGWTKRVLSTTLNSPSVLRAVDLDKDGRTDMLIAARIGHQVAWQRNLGGGTFAPVQILRSEVYSLEGIDAGDLNKDGLLDIIVSSSSGPRWLRQNAGFTFAAPAVIANTFGVSPNDQRTVIADFDKDGDNDVVTSISAIDRVFFSRNNGTGTFANPVDLSTSRDPRALAGGDFDGDGYLDIVSAGITLNEDDGEIFWCRNNRNGTFSAKRQISIGMRYVASLLVLDLDKDGDADIVAADAPGPVVWFENVRSGTFSAPKHISDGGRLMRSMVAGDFDKDGDQDLAAAQWDTEQFVWYRNSTPPAVVSAPQIASFTADDTSVASSATLRWNVSGATSVEITPDVGAVAASGFMSVPVSSTRTFTLTAKNAGGEAKRSVTVVVGEAPVIRSFTALDTTVTPGAFVDLAWEIDGSATTSISPSIGLVQATGTARQAITLSTPFTITATNEFGQSKATVTVNVGAAPIFSNLVAGPTSIARGAISTLSWSGSGYTMANVTDVGEVPVGNSIAVQPSTTRVYTVTLSNEYGSVNKTVTVTVTGSWAGTVRNIDTTAAGVEHIALADFNRDGIADLLSTTFDDGQANIFYGTGTSPTVFTTKRVITNKGRPYHVYGVDMDNDGDNDAVVSPLDTNVTWFPNNGSGAFGPGKTLPISRTGTDFFFGDLNGDGMTDMAGGVNSKLTVFLGTGGGNFTPGVVIEDFFGEIETIQNAAADMDGDGDIDLIAAAQFLGTVYWFENNGAGEFVNRHLILTDREAVNSIMAGDSDGDGDTDLFIRTAKYPNYNLELWVNPGTGNFSAVSPKNIPNAYRLEEVLCDYDLDGDKDLLIRETYSIFMIENKGANQFSGTTVLVENLMDCSTFEIGDLDRDGDPDVVFGDSWDDDIRWIENPFRKRLAPQAVSYFPVISTTEDFGELRIPLGPMVTDGDTAATSMTFSIRDTTHPELLVSEPTITSGRELLLRSKADLNGEFTARIRATDKEGLFTEFRVAVPIASAPDAPRSVPPYPSYTATPEGEAISASLASLFTDPDEGDQLAFSLTGNTTPGIFSNVSIDPLTGQLSMAFAPYVSGSSSLEVTATDLTGRSVSIPVPVELPALPEPQFGFTTSIALNRQTGLMEQSVTVTNSGARAIGGFLIKISGLPEGVRVNNATLTHGDVSTIAHRQPVAPGDSVTIVVEYFSAKRGTTIDPVVEVELTLPEAAVAPVEEGLAVERLVRLEDGSFLIEFTSEPGATYEVQYSADTTSWKLSPVKVQAGGNKTMWIDRGPPHTDVPPSEVSSRFYRVRRIDG